jgi:hypothetical protein
VLGALPVEVGPSAADLAAIEVEWPLIEAELAVVDAEIRLLACEGGPSVLDWRRLRRAQRQALRISAALKVARRNGGQVA